MCSVIENYSVFSSVSKITFCILILLDDPVNLMKICYNRPMARTSLTKGKFDDDDDDG